jgi:hypothetical protein
MLAELDRGERIQLLNALRSCADLLEVGSKKPVTDISAK